MLDFSQVTRFRLASLLKMEVEQAIGSLERVAIIGQSYFELLRFLIGGFFLILLLSPFSEPPE
jgi:hypothetical protein